MVVIALALWLVVTFVLAVPVALVLRRLDADDVEETVDPAELAEAMVRHPSYGTRAA
jgi:hypothetical protein